VLFLLKGSSSLTWWCFLGWLSVCLTKVSNIAHNSRSNIPWRGVGNMFLIGLTEEGVSSSTWGFFVLFSKIFSNSSCATRHWLHTYIVVSGCSIEITNNSLDRFGCKPLCLTHYSSWVSEFEKRLGHSAKICLIGSGRVLDGVSFVLLSSSTKEGMMAL